MVIQTLGKSYTVINYIFSDSNMERYLCLEDNGQKDIVVCIKNKKWIAETMDFLMGQRENVHFTDFRTCFAAREYFYVVMRYGEGISLEEKLRNERCSLPERMAIGRGILEKMLILCMPDYFLCDCLAADRVIVLPDLTVCFRYSLHNLKEYKKFSFQNVQGCLQKLYEILFFAELRKNMLPPLIRYYSRLKAEKYETVPDLYTDYDGMMGQLQNMAQEEMDRPDSWSFRLWERARNALLFLKKVFALLLLLSAAAFLAYAVYLSVQEAGEKKTFEYIGTLRIQENGREEAKP